MTKKELEELVKKQSEQISELISLVQNQKKEMIIVKEAPKTDGPIAVPMPYTPSTPIPNPWVAPSTSPNTPLPFNPYITWCDNSTEKHTITAPKTFSGTSLPDDFKDKSFNDFGDGKFETWDKEPEMIKAWDKLGIIGHNKPEGMV